MRKIIYIPIEPQQTDDYGAFDQEQGELTEEEQDECDYCGEIFNRDEADSICLEHDECVCPNCTDIAYEQYELMGDIEDTV